MEHKKYHHIGWLAAAAVCALVGAFFKFALVGYGFLGYGLWALTLLMLLIFALSVLKKRFTKTADALKKIIYYGFFIFCIALAVTEAVIISDSKTDATDEDYVIVLGAGVNGSSPSATLLWRIKAAYTYLTTYPDTICVVSGGQGPGENITEAECMYRWLISAGIEEKRIVKEERSESTKENLLFSKEIIDSIEGEGNYSAAIVTSDFHLCRAKTMAYHMGMETSGVSAKTELSVLRVNYYFREAFALWKHLILD